MSRWSRTAWSCVLIFFACAPLARAQRGQTRAAFSTADLANLKWLVGTWKGTAPNERTFYERYAFENDSTIEIAYFDDPTLSRVTGTGRVYLSVGRIYHTFGPGRWVATHIDDTSAFFIPQMNAHNTFAWAKTSPDSWTSTVRMGLSGHDRVTVYEMRRVGKR